MTDSPVDASGVSPAGAPGVIETAGIEIITESERTAKPRDLIWPWFAANVSVFGMSYGSYLLGFGISFVQATVVAIIGIRSEEHTSELQSRGHLVCRLLLEKK